MDKVVIVVGATGGLGSEVTKRFGSAGARIAVSDIARAMPAVEQLVSEVKKGPGEAFAYQSDVRIYQEVKAMVEETVKRWGKVDIMVDLAGGSLGMLTKDKNKLLIDHSEEDWDLTVDTNLKGSFNCIKAVAPQMIKQREGHIILVASGQGIRPRKEISSYAAAKAGTIGLMKAAAIELGEYNIKVNAITPGLIIHEQLYPVPNDQGREAYLNQTMLRRLSKPEDIADWVVFLSQKNNVSGQTYNLDSRPLF